MMVESAKKPSKVLKKSLIFTHDKLIPIIICIFGATTQVLTLFALYLSWPTTTVIELYSPHKIELPSVSFCLIFHRDDKFDLTLDQLDSKTPNSTDFVVECKVANASINPDELFNMVSCENVSPVKVYISTFLKCFTYFADMKDPYYYQRDDYYDYSFLEVKLNTNLTLGLTMVFVHENDEKLEFNAGSPDMKVLDKTYYNRFVLTYYTKTTEQLPFPYSNCVDYDNVHNVSRRTKILDCIYEGIYKEYAGYPDRSLISFPNARTNITFNRGIRKSPFRKECEENFEQPECETRLFEVHILQSEKKPDFEEGITKIEFGFPLGLQSDITKDKKFNDIEFFCYVASVISLWLEVSILTFTKFVFQNLRKLIRYLYKETRCNQET